MTLKNNRAPLLCCFKLYASFHNHRCIQSKVKVRKHSIRVKIGDFFNSIQFNSFIESQYKSITTTSTDSIHTSNGTPFCKYSALPIHHGKFPPKYHKGHPLSGLYVEVRGVNYEFIHELKKVIVFSLSNCVQYRFHLTAMYRESVAPVKQWNRFTVKSVHTHTKKTWVKCISEMYK